MSGNAGLTHHRRVMARLEGKDPLPEPVAPGSVDGVTSLLPQHLSYSQLSMYIRCGKQYMYRYLLGLKEPPSLPPTAGSAGHKALEANNLNKVKTGLDMDRADMLDVFSTDYDRRIADIDRSDLKPGDDVGRTKDEIASGLTTYHHSVAPKVNPILAEMPFDVVLPTPKPIRVVKGFIDTVRVLEPDRYVGGQPELKYGINDYKFTMSRKPKPQLEIDTSIQLTLYDLAFEAAYGKAPSRLGIIQFMPPAKDAIKYPAMVNVIERSPHLMTPEARAKRKERVINQFYDAERGIAASIFIPTDDPRTCGWCGYRDRCQDAL